MTFKNITAGELGNHGNNSDVLGVLYNKKPKDEDLDELINSLDTSIKLR